MHRIFFIMLIIILSSALGAQYLPIPDFYHRYDDILDKLFLWQDIYPDTVMVQQIGYSQEDDIPIYAVKVSSNVQVNEDKPAILIIGQVHAEEILGIEVIMYHIEEILQYRMAPPYSQWLSDLELWFIPTLNPEGLQVVMDDWDVTYRKNKRDNNGNGIFDYVPGIGQDIDGVDLNRNFDFNWVHGDTLYHPGGNEPFDYYRGPYPMSEGEIEALLNLLDQQHFVYSIVWHSSRTGNFSEKVFYSYDWYNVRPSPDYYLAQSIGQGVASQIRKYGSSLFYENLPSLGRTGNAHDWFYKEYGTIQLLVECGTSNIQPQSEAQMLSIVSEAKKGQRWLFNRALNGYLSQSPMLTGHIRDATTNQPLQAEVIIEQHHGRFLTPRMSDQLYGRYWRPLLAGIYTVTIRKEGYETQIIEGVAVNNSAWRILNIDLVKKAETVFTGTVLMENNPVDAEIILTDIEDHKIIVEDGSFIYDTYAGERRILITADGAYPYIGTIYLEPGHHDIEINLSEEHLIFMEDWDTGCCLWIIDGPWQTISENSMSGLAMTDSWDGGKNFYAPNTDTYITTNFPINLISYIPPYYQTPYLIFWQHLYTEWDHDFVYVQASPDLYADPEDWITVYKNSGKFDCWHPVYVSLEPLVGEEFYLRFRLTSDSPDSRLVDPGWIIDDLKIIAGNASLTSIDSDDLEVPSPKIVLNQNYPNPFNPQTVISFSITKPDLETAEITIFNIKGALVDHIRLSDEDIKQGQIVWEAGQRASGVYFYRLSVNGKHKDIKKAVLIK
ncbi:MAG: T9SS type A sorting domain-containing protein [Candidatus Cloacimonetes bacterium]|nr:T9SS type A sorting domain-containing protein [Candidatus Cloacimonadota bacterium]